MGVYRLVGRIDKQNIFWMVKSYRGEDVLVGGETETNHAKTNHA